MSKKHDIETYDKLASGASFYLNESFKYVDACLKSEFIRVVYQDLIEKIDPTQEDYELAERSNILISENVIDHLKSNDIEFLTESTVNLFKDAWSKAQISTSNKKHKFNKSHQIDSIEILGHLNNFGFFIETLANRHLLYLHQSHKIDEFCYARISVSKVMERLIFIFKEEISNKKLHLNEIANLFSLRNKTVHYTPDNSIALKPKLSELIQIWEQSKKLILFFEKSEKIDEEKFSDALSQHIDSFKSNWL